MSIFIPVVKDTYYETTLDTLDYKILLGGFTVFEGRAVKGPEGTLKINVNKIFKDYIENKITDFREVDGSVIAHPEAFRIFELRDSSDTLLETYGVLFDWDKEWNGQSALLSDPVRPSISQQMKFPISIYSPNGQTERIDFVPIVTNTYFRLAETSIIVPNEGGEITIQWETDFYPISDIIPTASIEGVTFSDMSFTGVTVTVPQSPSAEGREFTITFTYNGKTLGTVQVSQGKLNFTLITKTLNVPSTGGEYTIQWITDLDPSKITAYVSQWGNATVTNISSTGATVNFPPNTSYDDYEFVIYFDYESYSLGGTRIFLQGKSGATEGDTGNTTGVTIVTGVKDLVLTDDNAFAGFTMPAIQVWTSFKDTATDYYSNPQSLYYHSFGSGIGGIVANISSNIPLCSYSTDCPYTEGTSTPLVEFDGYALSGSTQWLNDYLTAAKEAGCSDTGNTLWYEGDSPRVATLYLLSGSTVLCENTVVQLPKGYSWYNSSIGSRKFILKTVTPFTFSDFKFKNRSFNSGDTYDVRSYLAKVIPAWNDFVIQDGIYKIREVGNNYFESNQQYDYTAFDLEYDSGTGWVTVKTPLPIYEIANVSGLSPSEIWISKNVRVCRGVPKDKTSGNIKVTYEGTLEEFKNVIVTTIGKLIDNSVYCSDGVARLGPDICSEKSEQVLYTGNQIRPSLCNEYFYQTDEPTIGNTVTITYLDGFDDPSLEMFIDRNGYTPSPISSVKDNDGEYVTATITFDREVVGIVKFDMDFREISDNLLYYTAPTDGGYAVKGSEIVVPSVKMRVLGQYVYAANTNLPPVYENNNLKFVTGVENFLYSSVKTFRAPNLVSIADEGFFGSYIEEFYIPSIQWIGTDALPATTTKVTVGKNFSTCSEKAFRKATKLTSLYFNGSVQEWEKLMDYSVDLRNIFTNSLSNITVVYCDNGEWTPQ